MLALLIFTGLFLYFFVHQFYLKRLNLPAGPLPLPIIGNFYQFMFKEKWEDKFLEWKEKYGSVYTIWLGIKPIITVNDYDTAVKIFVNDGDTYADRPNQDHFLKIVRGGPLGVGFSSGPLWVEQRRVSLRILRDFGLGKNQMQERILDEFQTVCDSLNKEINEGLEEHDVTTKVDIAVGSVMNSLLCGYRFTTNDRHDEFEKLKFYSNDFIKKFTDPFVNIGMNSEFMSKMPIVKPRILEFKHTIDKLFEFIDGIIEEHLKHNDYESENVEPLDFIDAYLLEMYKARKSEKQHYYSLEQCRNVVLDLWLGGQETSSNTLCWAIAFLINNPKVQQKIHDELDKKIGSDRIVTIKDRIELPYLNATILEIMRCANLAVINVPRVVGKDIELEGKKIKKGTMIVAQMSVIMADPKNFKNPKEFQPERFIDSKGQLINNEKVMPFSLGKRICPGEGLARVEIFLFLSNLLNHYKFTTSPNDSNPPSLKRELSGGFSNLKPYKCGVEKRKFN